MGESKTYVYFKKYTFFFVTFLKLLNLMGILKFTKVTKESKRIVLYTDLKETNKIVALRKLFFGFNFFSIQSIETSY